jgi:SecD/SecF fusion protein
MGYVKTAVCILLFFGAVFGAVWPIVRDGDIDWLYDMDIEGGVQITYRADFRSLPADKQTPEERLRMMNLSHLRLDSRLANFQGADVRVQILGADRLLVEVPGIRDIAKVRADLGKPKVVSFARVSSLSEERDAAHPFPMAIDEKLKLWMGIDAPVIMGGNILYDQMAVALEAPSADSGKLSVQYQLSLPLDADGQTKMAALTTLAMESPVQLPSGKSKGLPLLVLLLDSEFQDVLVVKDKGIREGMIVTHSREDAETLRRLLSSGPMPMPFEVYSERSISPMAGAALKQKAVWALPIAVLILFILMGFAYLERPWFLVVYAVTLVFWFLCLVTLANLHLIRISLLQLAGFALLLGMNSDSLVLVFEDLREDFKHERRFRMTSPVGKAFKTEWWVILWGMITTVAVVMPLAFQGGIFVDFIKLLLYGMAVNCLGFIFARLLMSTDLAADLSKISVDRKGLATRFGNIDFNRYQYLPIGLVLVITAIVGLFYPGIPLSPTFRGGRAVEIAFASPVSVSTVQSELARYFGGRAEILCEESADKTKWTLVKFPYDLPFEEQAVVGRLTSATGVQPHIVSVQTISRTLVEKTKLQVTVNMFLGLAGLVVLSVIIYNLRAGLYVALALVHDFLICLLAMVLFRVSLDLPTIAALATMVGYSIYDSIVVLHKLRALKLEKEKELGRDLNPFNKDDVAIIKALPAENIRRVPARVVLTSTTAALPLVVMALIAGPVFRDFAVITFAGAMFGTLSSLYIVGRVVPWGFVTWGSRTE